MFYVIYRLGFLLLKTTSSDKASWDFMLFMYIQHLKY